MKNRPKIQLESDELDKMLTVCTQIVLIVLCILPIYYYNLLPEQIPSHFNLKGEPDSFAPKLIVFLLPFLGICQYFTFRYLYSIPHTYNYPVEITAQNAAIQYKIGTRILRGVLFLIMLLFGYINIVMIAMGLGKIKSLSIVIVGIFLIILFVWILYHYRWAKKEC